MGWGGGARCPGPQLLHGQVALPAAIGSHPGAFHRQMAIVRGGVGVFQLPLPVTCLLTEAPWMLVRERSALRGAAVSRGGRATA